MNSFILEKLRCDARHVLDLAENASKLQHQGLKGRFRELLIDNFLAKWLPPYVHCGTGTIISNEDKVRQATQDDIILYDESLSPPIMASNDAPEGIFLYNSVLARIEVKSTLDAAGVGQFIQSSKEISEMKFSIRSIPNRSFTGAFNVLFAFKSDLTETDDLTRLCDQLRERGIERTSGIVSMICVANKGFWKIGLENDEKCWHKLKKDANEDNLVWFLGCLSNSCFEQHSERSGINHEKSLAGGIGMYLDHPFERV